MIVVFEPMSWRVIPITASERSVDFLLRQHFSCR
jgi:hypothetical protein